MNQFHHQRLLSGIRDSHRIPIQPDWAFSLRKQARLSFLPLFREIIVEWKCEKGFKRPFLTDLAEELFRGISNIGECPATIRIDVKEKVYSFYKQLSNSEKSLVKFYFLSEDENLEFLAQDAMVNITDDIIPIIKLDRLAGKTFVTQVEHFSEDDLLRGILAELHQIENIISVSDLECGLDAEAITRINEQFSNYLDMPYGEISLIQKPIDEFDFWKKVTAEEPETVGKRIQTSNCLEWAECWLLADGSIRVKGNLEDPGERNQAAIHLIRLELSEVLKAVHEQLIKHYELFDSHIHYTFFTRRKTLENVVPVEGIQFFVDQIEAHESDDFEPRINLDIRRYKNKIMQEWGIQIRLGIDDRYWQTEDEMYEFKVWVLSIEAEETPLEIRFSEDQKESIIQTILDQINSNYQLTYGIN